MKKLVGYEVDTWELTAHEVEVLTDAADQKDEGKREIFLDFDESTLLIEDCDDTYYLRVFEPGKGTERAFSLIQSDQEKEYTETMKKFDEIQEGNIFSHHAAETRSAFEKWLFCNGSKNEIKKRWHEFAESVSE